MYLSRNQTAQTHALGNSQRSDGVAPRTEIRTTVDASEVSRTLALSRQPSLWNFAARYRGAPAIAAGADAEMVAGGVGKVLLDAEIPFGGLNRSVPKEI